MSCDTNTWIIGETLRADVTVEFNGTATDPDTITAVCIDPEGTSQSATVDDEDGTGNYSAHHTPDSTGPIGTYRIRVTATHGTEVSIEDIEFPTTS